MGLRSRCRPISASDQPWQCLSKRASRCASGSLARACTRSIDCSFRWAWWLGEDCSAASQASSREEDSSIDCSIEALDRDVATAPAVVAKCIGQCAGEDLPEPGTQFGARPPAELAKRLTRLQESKLNDIRRVQLSAQGWTELKPCQHPEVIPVLLQFKPRGDWFLVRLRFANLLIRLKTPRRAKFIVVFLTAGAEAVVYRAKRSGGMVSSGIRSR